ncbi:MAG: hypothetical protein AAF583_15105 [Pseudomonadota bacterium]
MPGSEANIVHRVAFDVQPIVIVWGAQSPNERAPFLERGRGNTFEQRVKIAPLAVYGNSRLAPVQNNSVDTFPIESSAPYFHVASNAAFQIDAQLADDASTITDEFGSMYLDLIVELSSADGPDFGGSAQWPHTGGPRGGLLPAPVNLSQLEQPVTVFTANRKTAARRGGVPSQSVRFRPIVRSERVATQPAPEIVFTVYTL